MAKDKARKASEAMALAIVPISKGRLVKLKKHQKVTLSLEVTIELEPAGGELKVRVAAVEMPQIVPRAVLAAR